MYTICCYVCVGTKQLTVPAPHSPSVSISSAGTWGGSTTGAGVPVGINVSGGHPTFKHNRFCVTHVES